MLFQEAWNAKIATVANVGFIFGRTIFLKILKSPAPSSLAASIISSGGSSMNCLTRYNPTGIESIGMIWAQILSTKPKLFTMIYLGIRDDEIAGIFNSIEI